MSSDDEAMSYRPPAARRQDEVRQRNDSKAQLQAERTAVARRKDELRAVAAAHPELKMLVPDDDGEAKKKAEAEQRDADAPFATTRRKPHAKRGRWAAMPGDDDDKNADASDLLGTDGDASWAAYRPPALDATAVAPAVSDGPANAPSSTTAVAPSSPRGFLGADADPTEPGDSAQPQRKAHRTEPR